MVQETHPFPSKDAIIKKKIDAIICRTVFVGQSTCTKLSMFLYMLLLFFKFPNKDETYNYQK